MMKFTRVGTGVAAATATLMCVLSSPVLAVTKVSGAVAASGTVDAFGRSQGTLHLLFLGLIGLLFSGGLLSRSVLALLGRLLGNIKPGHGYD
jgi:hypothetical protein